MGKTSIQNSQKCHDAIGIPQWVIEEACGAPLQTTQMAASEAVAQATMGDTMGTISRRAMAVGAAVLSAWLMTGTVSAACPSPVSGVITFDTSGTFNCNYAGNSVDVDAGVTVTATSGQAAIFLNNDVGGSIVNNGTVAGDNWTIAIQNGATLNGNIDNFGLMSSTGQKVIAVDSSAIINGNITNYGTISGTQNGIDITNSTINGDIINNGLISAATRTGVKLFGLQNGNIINSFGATITTGGEYNSAISIGSNAVVHGDVINDGLLENTGGSATIWNSSVHVFGTLDGAIINSNTGVIRAANGGGIKVGLLEISDNEQVAEQGIVTSVYNAGLISGIEGIAVAGECHGIYMDWYLEYCDNAPSTINSITNTGEIAGVNFGIHNEGVISTLNNYQGTTGSGGSALTYAGNLPTFYNMIAYGDAYGQLAVDYDDHSGSLTFGIFGGDAANGIAATQLKYQTYVDVMTGLHVDDINNEWAQTTTGDHRSFGNYNGMLWMLREHEEDYSWNLEILNVADNFFLNSANAVAQRMSDLQGKIDMGAGSGYDCKMGADQKGCVSLKGGYISQGDGTSNGAVAVLGGFRLNDHVRVGGFLEQGFAGTDPEDVDYSSSLPSLGAYLALSQHRDSTGVQAKTSFAMSRGEAELSRMNLLGASSMASGTAGLNGYALAQSLGYGYALDNWSTLTPYVGIGYVSATRDSYTEDRDTSGVDDQFSYDSYNNNSTVGTLGLAFERDAYEGFNFSAGAGLTYVLASHSDDFEATSDVAGIETISAQGPYDATGELGVAGYMGAGYDITDNQKIIIDGNVWRSVDSGDYGFGVMAGWSMAFGGGEQQFSK